MAKKNEPFPEEDDGVPFDDYVFEGSYDYNDDVGLSDALDHEILMHRDSHFGGVFSVMIDYYRNEGRGVNPDFTLERIQFLADHEESIGQNLAALLLSGPEAERVAKAKEAYKNLRDLYDLEDKEAGPAFLIADLILSEEETPEKEIANIVAAGPSMVPPLLDLVQSEEFSDPLFPGYGLAPQLAAICLGHIGDPQAIVPLFELLGREGFFMEEDVLSALKNIGEPSKAFLLKVLQSRPLTEDNERAAMALSVFSKDSVVGEIAVSQLKDSAILKKHDLVAYLILCCEGLKSPYRDEFKKIAKNPLLAQDLRTEMHLIERSWDKE